MKKQLFHKQYETDNGLFIDRAPFVINFIKGDKCVRISKKHKIYFNDLIDSFDYYFSSVEPEKTKDYDLVDFSKPKAHRVIGFDLHKVKFSSFAEPIETTHQYIDFAQLNEDSVVLDLGAYSGLTSILFDIEISKNNKQAQGKVIAVDPDIKNSDCIKYNFQNYQDKTGRKIEYLHGAVWCTDGEIEFSSEGNMGASALAIVGEKRGFKTRVKSYTLSSIAKKYNLNKIDFIKCDIEGGELNIFNDEEFFKNYKPKIIIEAHYFGDKMELSSGVVINTLSKYAYSCKEIKQNGVELPLIECYPD